MLVKEQVTALLCTHVYHTGCIDAYCLARNKDIMHIPCPQCKRSPASLVDDGGSLSDAEDTGPESDEIVVMPAPGVAVIAAPEGAAAASSSDVPHPEPRIVVHHDGTMLDLDLPPPTAASENDDEEAEEAEEDSPDKEPAVTPKAKARAKAESKANAKAKTKAETKSKAKAVAKAKAATVDEFGGAVEPTAAATTAIAKAETKSKAKAAAKARAATVDEFGGAVEPTAAATTAIAKAETKSKAKGAAKARAATVDEFGGALETTAAATTAIALMPKPKAPEFKVAQLFQGLAICDTCEAYQPFDKVRVKSKCQQIFRCNACHSKQCTLRRAFGRWPTEAFTSLDKDSQSSFWQSLTSLSGRNMIACRPTRNVPRRFTTAANIYRCRHRSEILISGDR